MAQKNAVKTANGSHISTTVCELMWIYRAPVARGHLEPSGNYWTCRKCTMTHPGGEIHQGTMLSTIP